MLKKNKITICSMLVFFAASIYIILNSDSNKRPGKGVDFEEIDSAMLSESDIDIIVAVKEKMKAVVPSAHAAE